LKLLKESLARELKEVGELRNKAVSKQYEFNMLITGENFTAEEKTAFKNATGADLQKKDENFYNINKKRILENEINKIQKAILEVRNIKMTRNTSGVFDYLDTRFISNGYD